MTLEDRLRKRGKWRVGSDPQHPKDYSGCLIFASILFLSCSLPVVGGTTLYFSYQTYQESKRSVEILEQHIEHCNGIYENLSEEQ